MIMGTAEGVMKRFSEVIKERHQYAQQWKRDKERKVLGYTCTYVPEEVIYASGILPVRIIGSHTPSGRLVEDYMPKDKWCAFSRDCLAEGLRGSYSYLDGLVGAQSCMHHALTFFTWKNHISVPYVYHFYVPRTLRGSPARICLEDQISDLKSSLESWIGSSISTEALSDAIKTYNENRHLLGELYSLRRQDNPPIRGAEVMQIVLSSQLMDKAEHSLLLRQLLDQLSGMKGGATRSLRLMVIGSEDDDTAVIQKVEDLGATVVIDDHCVGTRYFSGLVSSDDNPLSALASRYFDRPPCPTKDPVGAGQRLEYVKCLAQEYRVEAVFILAKRFCDPHNWQIPRIRDMFQDMQVPSFTTLQELKAHLAKS
jgi:benzoyl-CoA reductase subunit C